MWITFFPVFIFAAIMPATLQSKELQSLEAIAEGSNKFAIDLYQKIKDKPGNLVVSPISAQIVLTLAHHGANGTTAEEMAKVLHLPSNKEQSLEGHKALILGLRGPELNTVNKMFIGSGFHLKQDFQSLATSYFLSSAEQKDFAQHPSEARTEINNWVEENTNKKIKDLLPQDAITPNTRLILVNAIHFKAKWAIPFNERHTEKAPFHISETETVDVDMMRLDDKKFKMAFSEKLGCKILEMPYEGRNFSMIIFLPNEINGLPQLESKLADINLGDELANLREMKVNVKLPRFKIEATMQLKDSLSDMGMKSAFSDGADFSLLSEEAVKIDQVIQKAFIEVNEEGTEAAAATGVTFVLLSAYYDFNVIQDFKCDRPFVFFIIHSKTNSILFSSRISSFQTPWAFPAS